MACLDFNEFSRFIMGFDQAAAIEKDKDKPLRYNVWKTTSEEVSALTNKLDVSVLPDSDQSLRILEKMRNSMRRIRSMTVDADTFQKEVLDDRFNKEMAIAMQEVLESTKGEADKARNMGQDISTISREGRLPNLPAHRVAASIGRKIAFQKGYRFKRAVTDESAAAVEALYYDVGMEAIRQLEQRGYLSIDTNVPTLFDYQNKQDLRKDRVNNDPTRSDVMSISLNEKKLGITDGPTADYFLRRTEADIDNTQLGVITEKLRIANMILQPATTVLPDTEAAISDADLRQWDDGIRRLDPKTEKARRHIHKKPVKVNKALHSLLDLLHEETKTTGVPASKRLRDIFGNRPVMINALFGLKRSDDFSIDKKESIGGQNLSKTTPIDDLAEYWNEVRDKPLHMRMKVGRNARLYYLNSVLNAHGSKHSRHMLTPGEYTVNTGSADYDYLVHQVGQVLNGDKFPVTYDDVVGKTAQLNKALQAYEKFKSGSTLRKKTEGLAAISRELKHLDFVQSLTALQAVQDIRNADGKVTTEFPVAADATASGGQLTFMQALGTSPSVKVLLQRIGILKDDGTLDQPPLRDLYQLMSNSIEGYLAGEVGLGPDIGQTDATDIMKTTLDLLFNKGEKIRELSKDPTMTFIYGQGKKSAVDTMARSLADKIIDRLNEDTTQQYLIELIEKYSSDKGGDPEFRAQIVADVKSGKNLNDTRGLYNEIVRSLKSSGFPETMYDIMDQNIKAEFLENYITRSEAVYGLIKKLAPDTDFRILPAGAVLSGDIKPTKKNLQKYGMPISKIVEVLNTFDGKPDTVLTRKGKLQKTVMDVSTTHGQDAALLYHALADVAPNDGTVAIHDEIRGSVATVRAMEKAYAKTAVKLTQEYDVHQQVMEAIAAYDPELAKSSEYVKLKAAIDKQVAEKRKIISELFNEDTEALIGDGKQFEQYKNSNADTDTVYGFGEDTVQSSLPEGTPLPDQDFGDATITLTEGDESVEVLAQEYWDQIKSRLNMVETLRTCLTS